MNGFRVLFQRTVRAGSLLTARRIVLACAFILFAPAILAQPIHYLQDGNGYWWDFAADGSVVDGSPTSTEATDAFDGAMRLRIDGVLFPETPNQGLSGRILTTGPETVSGLVVTRRAYVPAAAGQGWACFLEYLANPTGAPINAAVRITGNLGSDQGTTVTASSSGDTLLGIDDRWVTSDDANNGGGDPSLSFNYWGLGAEVTPTAVYLPASQEDYYVEFPVTVPAESTVILMHFCAQNANDAAALATATNLDALPPAALVGLNAASGHVINWSVPPDNLSVTPSGVFITEGKHGGPFAPASQNYTLTNGGAAPLNWSASVDVPWLTVPAGGAVNPGTPANALVSLNAQANDLEPGGYSAAITFTNTTSGASFVRNVQLTVNQRLTVAAEDFLVAGSGTFVVRGRPGGPFTPVEATYTLTNVDDQAIDWSMSVPAWLSVSATPPLGTSLAPGASARVTVSLAAPIAGAMALGDYAANIDFNNDTIGNKVSAKAELRIRDVIFVRSEGMPPFDGITWAGAYNLIQAGINAAAATTPPSWVFVKAGTYHETLTMLENVEVFGGFLGTETHFTERDLENNPPAIINGQRAGRTVLFSSIDNAGLDGVTVSGGLEENGGGILFDGTGPGCYLSSTIVRENVARFRGGGVYCLNGSSPSFWNCEIIGNRIVPLEGNVPEFGGGIACFGANPNLLDCLIAGNDGRFGGGVGCIQSSPTLTNCIISGNSATIPTGGAGGGGVFAHNQSSPILTNCVISGNYAHDWNAGTLFCQGRSHPVLTNCTLSSNSSNDGRSGGIVVNTGSKPILVNCIIEGLSGIAIIEEAPSGGLPLNEADVFVSYSLFSGNAVADIRDWSAGAGHVNYTGGDEINANVDGAHNNVPGGPDPRYVDHITGLWTAHPVYDPVTNLTTLTTSGDPFPATSELKGRLINANMAQSRQALIMENTANTVSVLGNITATDAYGYAASGDKFQIVDYHLKGISPCVNAGDDHAACLRDTDIEGLPRVDTVDIGAYENQNPAGVAVVSITPQSGPITNEEMIVFEVLFSRAVVSGLSIDDFVVNFAGLNKTPPSVVELTGSDYLWFVTVNTGSENGRVTLDLVDTGDPITDIVGLNLDAPFTGGDETVINFLEIVTHPTGGIKVIGEGHSFHVAAENGIGTLHYQWKHNGVPRGGDAPTLALAELTLGDEGTYLCEVSDDYTMVPSNPAVLTVRPSSTVPLTGALGMSILTAACTFSGAWCLRRRK